jgi:hypothetical protein
MGQGIPLASPPQRKEIAMTSKRSNQRNAFGKQSEDRASARPGSRKFEGRRSEHKAGEAAANRPRPGKAQKEDR